MHRLMIGLGIAVLALAGLSVGLAGDAWHVTAPPGEGDGQIAGAPVTATAPLTWYLPLVARNYAVTPTTVITVPLQFVVGQSVTTPPSWETAFDATGYFRTTDGVYVEAANSANEYVYRIDRAFLLARVPRLAGGRIVSAGAWFFAASTGNCTVTVHAGEWPGSSLPEFPEYWQGYGDIRGMAAPGYDPSGYWVPLGIPLDLAGFMEGEAWKGVLRVPDDVDASYLGPYGGTFTAAGDCAGLPSSVGAGCFEPYLRLVVLDG